MTSSIDSYSIVRRDGHDFIKLLSGRLIPILAGGDGDGGDGGNKEPTLADVMALLKQQGALIAKQQEQISANQSKVDEFIESVVDAMGPENDDDCGSDCEPPDTRNQNQNQNNQNQNQNNQNQNNDQVAVLQRTVRKLEKNIEEMQKVVKQREEQAEQERELRLESQRDTLLSQALTSAGVHPDAMDAAMKYFRDDVYYDEKNDRFVFNEPKTGVKLAIEEGVKDNLPPYFKAATIKQGGSGGRGSQPNQMLENARTQLARLHEQAKKSGSEADISAYHSAKKKLIELEGQGKPVGSPVPNSSGGVNRSQVPSGAGRGRQSADGDFNEGES